MYKIVFFSDIYVYLLVLLMINDFLVKFIFPIGEFHFLMMIPFYGGVSGDRGILRTLPVAVWNMTYLSV